MKRKRIIAAAAGLIALLLVVGLSIFFLRRRDDAFQPMTYAQEEDEKQIKLSVEEDKAGGKAYESPVPVYETVTDVEVGKGE